MFILSLKIRLLFKSVSDSQDCARLKYLWKDSFFQILKIINGHHSLMKMIADQWSRSSWKEWLVILQRSIQRRLSSYKHTTQEKSLQEYWFEKESFQFSSGNRRYWLNLKVKVLMLFYSRHANTTPCSSTVSGNNGKRTKRDHWSRIRKQTLISSTLWIAYKRKHPVNFRPKVTFLSHHSSVSIILRPTVLPKSEKLSAFLVK